MFSSGKSKVRLKGGFCQVPVGPERHTVPVRILVVEDDVKLMRVLERGLRLEGHDVRTATTGDAGLALALTGEFDTVVLDLMLPGLDGFEICRSLRAAEVTTPVLMLTALGGVTDR